ncbi:MAG: HK97 gp10 family phage protein [Lentisphaerae bacterium]|nr:HK97 gp10 family phage protein [Lentisphaerota bacterium]
MADGIDLKVSGIDEVNKALYSYSQQLGDKVILKALREGAKIVQKEARNRAPRRTGKLRRNIVVKNSQIYSKRRNAYKLGVYLSINKKGKASDRRNAYYGRFHEDGWNTHGKLEGTRQSITQIFGKRTGRKTQRGKTDMQAQKFMKGAFDSRKHKALKMIIKATERGSEIIKRKTGLK